MPDKLGGEFEFEVGRDDYFGSGNSIYYTVRLPHQCDHWEITYTQDKAQAIAEMETFVREAQAALEALREACP